MEIMCLGKGKAPGLQCLFCVRRNVMGYHLFNLWGLN